jgi:hypothetical protein
MEKLNRKLSVIEVIHAGLVALGSILLLYIWQGPLAQPMGYYAMPMTMLPLFLFLTVGILVWDRLIHGLILKGY